MHNTSFIQHIQLHITDLSSGPMVQGGDPGEGFFHTHTNKEEEEGKEEEDLLQQT